MSLVHESIVAVLNRRFVNCYFSSFPDIGHDSDGASFTEALPADIRRSFTFILTPDGEVVESFGIHHDELVHGIRSALRKHPQYNWQTEEEKAVIAQAAASPANFDAQIRAAVLASELLQFEKATTHAGSALAVAATDGQSARAAWLSAHLQLLDHQHTGAVAVRMVLNAIENPPKDLQDDIAADLLATEVELIPRIDLFTYGHRFAPGDDARRRVERIKKLIARYPDGNRIGQLHFYLGLAHVAAGDTREANLAWEEHFTRFPEDRFATLSRMHHESYPFSIYGRRMPNRRASRTIAEITFVPDALILKPGQQADVDLFVRCDTPIHAFQCNLVVTGGSGGGLIAGNVEIHANRKNYLFYDRQQVAGCDLKMARLGAVLFNGDKDAKSPAYLGTFTIQASPDARGRFTLSIDAPHSPLYANHAQPIPMTHIGSATITVPTP